MTILQTPLNLRSSEQLNNRFVKSAMSEQLADQYSNPTDELCRLYSVWADGGSGLLISGNVMVDRRYLGEPKNIVLDSSSDLSLFKKWSKSVEGSESKLWLQLNHPGKQIPIYLSREALAPSAIELGSGLAKVFAKPVAMSEAQIQRVIDQFVFAAQKAQETGFTGVQVHGAHGYLISQFLSPKHNCRDDEWGGSIENRARLLTTICKKIRQACGQHFSIGVKINGSDFVKGGMGIEESSQVCQMLDDIGVDLIEVSGGNYENPKLFSDVEKGENDLFSAYSMEIKNNVKVPIVLTGGLRNREAMLRVLNEEKCDCVGIARPMTIYPNLVKDLLANRLDQVKFPKPSTGFKSIDRYSMLDVIWYEQQMHRIAKGRSTSVKLSPWKAIIKNFMLSGQHAFSRRRF